MCGLYISPAALVHADTDIKGAEYTNGVLTVEGILFGIWAIILSNLLGKEPRGPNIKAPAMTAFYMCLGLLIISVILLTMAGLGWYSLAGALIFSAVGCIINAYLLSNLIRYYPNTDTK